MRRIFFTLAFTLTAVLVIGIAFASIAYREASIRSFEEHPPAFASFIIELVHETNDLLDEQQFETLFSDIADNNEDYTLVSDFDTDLISSDVLLLLMDGHTVWIRDWEWPDHRYHGGLAIHLPNTMTTMVMRPTQQPFPPVSTWLTILVVLGAVVMTACFIFLLPIMRSLNKLEIKAKAIAAGDFSLPKNATPRRDAIGDLEIAMDDMAEKIHNSLDKQTHMIMAIAHELRTPISRVQFGIEMLSMTEDSQKKQRRRQAIDADIVELDQLVEELLTYSRYDNQAVKPKLEIVEVSLPETISLLKERLGYKKPNIEIIFNEPENPLKSINLPLHPFNRVLSNLIGNALRYANSRIELSYAVSESGYLIFYVDDDGTGIPPEQRANIFEPFTRLERSRERDKGGVGLGLAIVAQIMRAVGGTVQITDAPIGGARFILRWPLAK